MNSRSKDEFIVGTGTDAKTLTEAGIETAAGVIAGTDNDSNNLSIVMTARQLNKHVFFVGRQNYKANKVLYNKINVQYHKNTNHDNEEISNIAHLVMQPSEIIARRVRAVLIAPLLLDFINLALPQDQEWANIMISRMSAVIGEQPPYLWTVNITKENAPAIAQALGYGRRMLLKHIIQAPASRQRDLPCIALIMKRGDELNLLPEEDMELKAFDQLLFCGLDKVEDTMYSTLNDLSTLNYIMTSKNEPQSYIWKNISRRLQKLERRAAHRGNRR